MKDTLPGYFQGERRDELVAATLSKEILESKFITSSWGAKGKKIII